MCTLFFKSECKIYSFFLVKSNKLPTTYYYYHWKSQCIRIPLLVEKKPKRVTASVSTMSETKKPA